MFRHLGSVLSGLSLLRQAQGPVVIRHAQGLAVTSVTALMLCGCTMVSHAEVQAVPHFNQSDWLLVCDNTLSCQAVGYPPEANTEEARAGLVLTRAAGPNTAVTGRWVSTVSGQAPWHLWMNQQDLGAVEPDGRLTNHQVQQLVAMASQYADIRLKGANLELPISDKGISAVLRHMDAVQKRLNTPNALIVKGERSESSVPSAPEAPVIHQAEVIDGQLKTVSPTSSLGQQLSSLLAESSASECSDPEEGIHYADLTSDKALVVRGCWSAAYNAGSTAVVIDRDSLTLVQDVTSDATNYDQGTLSMTQKGRGLGDCFYQKQWTFNGEAFVVSQQYSTGLCRLFPGGIAELPTYTAEVIKP